MSFYRKYTKPFFDYLFATILIIALAPLLLALYVIGILVFGKAIFRQKRIGRHEEPFTFFKFRSMRVAGDESTIPVWGKFIRKTSLDELPQLINIMRGEMSFIGPRPLLPEYLPHYSKKQNKRHRVKPGISGLAQINGRNALSWKESLNFDVQYARKISLKTDIGILLGTAVQLFKFSQVQQQQNLSRESFIKDKQK